MAESGWARPMPGSRQLYADMVRKKKVNKNATGEKEVRKRERTGAGGKTLTKPTSFYPSLALIVSSRVCDRLRGRCSAGNREREL